MLNDLITVTPQHENAAKLILERITDLRLGFESEKNDDNNFGGGGFRKINGFSGAGTVAEKEKYPGKNHRPGRLLQNSTPRTPAMAVGERNQQHRL